MHTVFDVWRQLTLAGFIASAIDGLVLTAMIRVVMKAFAKIPRSERLYWIAVPLTLTALILTAEVTVSDPPRLSGSLEYWSITNRPDDSGHPTNHLAIIVVARIVNGGSPTIVDTYKLRIEIPGEPAIVSDRPTQIPNEWRVAGRAGQELVYYAEDNLALKTSQHAIEKGAAVNGILPFAFEGQLAEGLRPGTKTVLSFRDVRGNNYNIENTIGRESLPIGGFVGLRSGPVTR